jgi:hypothetical protein
MPAKGNMTCPSLYIFQLLTLSVIPFSSDSKYKHKSNKLAINQQLQIKVWMKKLKL